MKKKLLIALACLLAIAGVLCGIYWPESELNNTIDTVQNIVVNEIKEIDNQSTIEIPKLTETEEQTLEVQKETEMEGLQEQGNISYNGDYISQNVTLGDYAGLTYYSQVDSRWKNHSYTSVGDNSQTIGTSGCGPTSAAMVVSSIRGTIAPNQMRRSIYFKWLSFR